MYLLRPEAVGPAHVYLTERILHGLLAASFLALVYTGFALHYPNDWWAKPLLAYETHFPLRGTVHRASGVVLVLTALAHVVSLIVSRTLRHHWTELLPRLSDAREMVEGTLWRLGLRRERPHQSAHSYIEKIEYWALVWGTIVMAATGTLLWANNWTLSVMPKEWMDFGRTVHFYEAILAAFSILIWHFYSVIFDPEVYPMNPSWITGHGPEQDEPQRDVDADANG
jgi:cytochrome b subunit of formate dehydrogenase